MIRNPFDITQYASSFIKENVLLDSSGIGLTGIDSLMQFLTSQVRIRQEAIRIGYISNNPSLGSGDYSLINISNLSYDNPASLRDSSLRIVDSVKQMFQGHPSRLYEKLVYRPTIISGLLPGNNTYNDRAGGFFHAIVNPLNENETPSDLYFTGFGESDFVDGTHLKFIDITRFNNVPEFTSAYVTFNDYIKDQVDSE